MGGFAPFTPTRGIAPGPFLRTHNTHFQAMCRYCLGGRHHTRARRQNAASRMQSIRKNEKKRRLEKACFLSRRFLVFIVPVKIVIPFPKLLAHSSSIAKMSWSHTGVQRRISSGEGYRGREAPCSMRIIPVPPGRKSPAPRTHSPGWGLQKSLHLLQIPKRKDNDP